MEKEFIPYEQALALEELGFDKPCFGFYENEILKPTSYVNDFNHGINHNVDFNNIFKTIKAPLFSQAFRWFREKCKLFHEIALIDNSKKYGFEFVILNSKIRNYDDENCMDQAKVIYSRVLYSSYEEAELECLKQLIKLVKNEVSNR